MQSRLHWKKITFIATLGTAVLLQSITTAAAAFAMSPNSNVCTETQSRNLDLARQLPLPSREKTLRRDPSVSYFWNRHRNLLEGAWKEWEESEEAAKSLPKLDESLIHPKLRKAIQDAWEDPSKEDAVRNLWEEVHPGVYACQFFDLEKIQVIKDYFDTAAEAGVPTRPPYGIVLNRRGFMLDPRSEGYLAIPEFQKFYKDVLIDSYARPLAHLFFGDYIQKSDASESFGFSINYTPQTDQGIRWHSDSSAMTFNINMDSEETWKGSSLLFQDRATGKQTQVHWKPGYAMIHRGAIPHTALPITDGERSNIVLWVMGRGGQQSFMPYDKEEQMDRAARWTKPVKDENEEPDMWAPF